MQHVVSQLIEKRKELEGEAIFYQEKLETLTEQIRAIDTSIVIFDPEFNPKGLAFKRFSPHERYFRRGESMILVFDILRKSEKPLSTSELADKIVEVKNLDLNDKDLRNRIRETIRVTLHNQEKKGILVCDKTMSDLEIFWSIKK